MKSLKKDKIIELYLEGVSGKDIGERLNTPSQYVYNVLKNNDIETRSKKTPLDTEREVINLYNRGYSYTKIVSEIEYEISKSTVKNILKRNGIVIRNNKVEFSDELEKLVLDTYSKGHSQRKTAEICGTEHYVVRKILTDNCIHKRTGSFNRNEAKNICSDYKNGIGVCKIAKKFGVSSARITAVLKSNGIEISASSNNQNGLWKGYGEISGSFFNDIKTSAKRRNIEFDITIEFLWDVFLKQGRTCALSGKELIFGSNKKEETSASVDRIDSSKGYTEDNVQWVDKTVNVMKWSLSQEDFIEICKQIAENNR